MTAAELNPELRNLIDARLEEVDHILMRVQTGWAERRNIVSEVETQIYELLSRRSSAPTDEDVRAVLATIDPPEAYIPEEFRDRLSDAPSGPASPPQPDWRPFTRQSAAILSRFARGTACVSAVVVANGLVLLLIVSSDGIIPWLVTLGGLGWLNYAGIRWFRTWSATRQGTLLDEVRSSLSAWLMPKNHVHAT